MKDAFIHLHKRKRIHKKHEKYPHPDSRIRLLDDIVMFIAVIIPFTTLPQIYKIFVYKNAAGVSIVTWSLYLILTIPLLIYGLVHKEKPLIVMYSLWLLIHASVIFGIFLYG